MKLASTLFIFLSFYVSSSWAQVRVAFIEQLGPKGEKTVLEEGGRFFHLAIQVGNGQWLQSHPKHGTILTVNLNGMGEVTQVLENSSMRPVKISEIKHLLGQPFDKSYSFKSKVSSYCSKLVGHILDIPPKKRMSFSGKIWKHAIVKRNQPGWSPDYIYRYLMNEMNFKELILPFMYGKVDLSKYNTFLSCRGIL